MLWGKTKPWEAFMVWSVWKGRAAGSAGTQLYSGTEVCEQCPGRWAAPARQEGQRTWLGSEDSGPDGVQVRLAVRTRPVWSLWQYLGVFRGVHCCLGSCVLREVQEGGWAPGGCWAGGEGEVSTCSVGYPASPCCVCVRSVCGWALSPCVFHKPASLLWHRPAWS